MNNKAVQIIIVSHSNLLTVTEKELCNGSSLNASGWLTAVCPYTPTKTM